MKQISKLLLAACFLSCAVFMGCKDDPTDEEVLTKPVITFKDNIKEGESPVTVSATIVSDFNLKSVKIEKNFTNAANNEVVETITSFPNNPKELVYEHEFVIPDGLVKMDIKFTAVNVKDLSTEATFVITGKISITQTDIIDAMAEAYAGWEVDGTFPVELTIKGITFNKAQIFGYACQTLINLKNNQTTPLTLLNVGPCEIGDLDDYTTPEISIGAMIDQANRQLTYGSNNGIWANYASFGSYQATPYTDEYGPYQGRFSFDRATVCFARIFAAYKTSGTLPATVNADFKLIAPYSPGIVGSFTKDQLVTAIADAYNAAFGTGNSILPDNITVNGTELTKVQYFYAAARLLLYINENNPANIAVLTYLMPENPANDSYDASNINVVNGAVNGANTEDLVNIVQRQLNYVTNKALGNGNFSNYVGYTRGEGETSVTVGFSFNRTLVCLARAIASYKANGTFPEKVSTNYLPPVTTTIGQFIAGYVTILNDWEVSGESGSRFLTNDFTIEVNYVTYTKGQCFEAACRIIQAFDNAATLASTLPVLSNFATSGNPDLENSLPLTTLNDEGVEINMVINMAGRQLTFAAGGGGGAFANQVNYTGGQVAGYGGYCSQDRGTLIIARLFKHLLDNEITNDCITALASVKVSAEMK